MHNGGLLEYLLLTWSLHSGFPFCVSQNMNVWGGLMLRVGLCWCSQMKLEHAQGTGRSTNTAGQGTCSYHRFPRWMCT